MDFRLWVLCLTASFLATGCAAPMRTFVSGKEASIEDPFQVQTEPPEAVKESRPPKTEANPVKPSVWSQWMGAFSKPSADKADSKPKERIVLPRTDLESSQEGAVSEPGQSRVSDF
jgi:hypothetical protein